GGGALRQRDQRPLPDHVLHRGVVAEEGGLARLGVEDEGEAGVVEAGVVEEGAVLVEAVRVGRVVHRDGVVAEEEDEAVADSLGEVAAACGVGGGAEHGEGGRHEEPESYDPARRLPTPSAAPAAAAAWESAAPPRRSRAAPQHRSRHRAYATWSNG